jgi:hypothetical protein
VFHVGFRQDQLLLMVAVAVDGNGGDRDSGNRDGSNRDNENDEKR